MHNKYKAFLAGTAMGGVAGYIAGQEVQKKAHVPVPSASAASVGPKDVGFSLGALGVVGVIVLGALALRSFYASK